MTAYRPDIDGLRAICILSVVMFHGGFEDWAGGFVGVDIFFVISGYLITSLIARQIALGQFTLRGFYERRIRRLLAATIPVAIFTTLFALAFYTSEDLVTYCKSLLAFFAYGSNWFFLNQTGYFATAPSASPLLHTWSLAVEEQFYLVFPVLLWVIWRVPRALPWIVAALAILSFAYAEFEISRGLLDRAFFSSPARFWELLAGALLAIVPAVIDRTARFALPMRAIGLSMIGGSIFLYGAATPFPGVAALLPVCGALLIIAASPDRKDPAWRLLTATPVVYLGRISYSLYLWHWPVLGACRILSLDQRSDGYTALAIAFSVALAALSYHLVEQPVRTRRLLPRGRHMAAMLAVTSGVGVAVGASGWATGGWPMPRSSIIDATLQRATRPSELPSACFQTIGDAPAERQICRFGDTSRDKVDLLLWGDSHARAIFSAVRKYAEERGLSLAVAARATCPPLLELRRLKGDNDTSEGCAEFNKAAEAFIRAHDVPMVLMVVRWSAYANLKAGRLVDRQDRKGGGTTREVLETGMRRTLDALQGRTVAILEQVPEQKAKIPSAYRVLSRLGGSLDSVRVDRATHARRQKLVAELLGQIAAASGVLRIDPAEILCASGLCIVEAEGKLLYVDANHLSIDGSLLLYPFIATALDQLRAGNGIVESRP